MLGRGKSGLQNPVDLLEVFIRAAGNAATESRAGGGELWEIGLAFKKLVRRQRPILDEGMLDFSHDRPRNLEMKVFHATSFRTLNQIPLRYVHPAGKAGVPVDHQNLTMVAKIEPEAAKRKPQRKEGRYLSPGFQKKPAHTREGLKCPDAVHQHMDSDTALGGLAQCGRNRVRRHPSRRCNWPA